MYRFSLGVDVGVIKILFIMLSSIPLIFFIWSLLGFQVSAPYVMIGMMHVSTSFHIVSISLPLKFLSFAMYIIVWYATSVFLSIFFMWSSRLPLLLIISHRYLYSCVYSICISPSLRGFLGPMYVYFSFPNSMHSLLAVSEVISKSFCWS